MYVIFFTFIYFVCGACDLTHFPRYLCRDQRTTCKSHLSFHHMGPTDQIRVIRLDSKTPLPTGPSWQTQYVLISRIQSRGTSTDLADSFQIGSAPKPVAFLLQIKLYDARILFGHVPVTWTKHLMNYPLFLFIPYVRF